MRIRRGFMEAIGAIETGRLLVQCIRQQHAHAELLTQPWAARYNMSQQKLAMLFALLTGRDG